MIVGWAVAWGGADEELLRQRELVDAAAAAVAEARAEGQRREVAERLAVYRTAAAELERLSVGPSVDEVLAARRRAVSEVRLALAEGRRDSPARAVIVGWLGEPATRLEVLAAALASASGAPASIRRAVLLDVIEQGDALSAVLAFDAVRKEAEADQLELRAVGLQRRGPGQTPTIADEVEAVRLLTDASTAEEEQAALLALRQRALDILAAASAAMAVEIR